MAKKKPSKKSHPNSAITVDMVSDIVCPWCWLGKRYFDHALKRFKTEAKKPAAVELSFRPYMLDPDVPQAGVPYRDYMKNKFGDGPSDRFKAMRQHLEDAAPDAGINFKFDAIPMRPNTLRAHSLIRWAQNDGKGSAVKEALFKAFFQDLKDVGDIAVLTDIANAAGMDAALVADLLAEGRDSSAVVEEIEFFRKLGVSGVPFFIYNGQYAVQGAQGSDAHLQMMQKLQNAPQS